ncbi:Pimeloyl-ACP methyl ester carboxylesterase [Haloplanus vescus]|uniref:Pimeloyl-ACP methyl ester carboxylesterase n=1 Tax=Haloplanus vescus TaxID=555874 RepID=A0A1H3X1Q7_9EURY|nr:alpha/beta hydrolase [Haloplanus vescus]SDZ92921.1 Pimeloyl-ACP methyl ester carboxylesterase [Haloplanus vescus]
MDAANASPPLRPRADEGSSTTVDVGVDLHVVRLGPQEGTPVVLLHGFPECWYGWLPVARRLADDGYRVLVPDQRGYNASEKPSAVSAYRLPTLAEDIATLVDRLGHDAAHVVGHDWGAAVAWWLALDHPERVATLTAVNVPHPTVMRRTLRRSWDQRRRSWYMALFQVPVLPERLARVGDYRLFERTMRSSSRADAFADADFDRYRAAWAAPGALTGMVNWYRAAGRHPPAVRTEPVEPPTLVCWGVDDAYLRPSMARESVAYCRDGRAVLVDDATHWLHRERPGWLADRLDEWMA